MKYACCDERRLEVLRRSASTINAIEFIEVLDRAAPTTAPRQRTLFVRLLRDPGATLVKENFRITGGVRIPTVDVEWFGLADEALPLAEPGLLDGVEEPTRTLVIRTTTAGDFSRYTLALISQSNPQQPPANFDPLLSRIEFSFKVECPADIDCDSPLPCPPPDVTRPRIDYLAKDYAGFRRLMMDRLNLLVPGWTERSAADQGVALVELLAYAADSLSYRQDVIANEAYLHTARQRISVRRHARLVDYYLHEGCNARAFVHLRLNENVEQFDLPAGTALFTQVPALPDVTVIVRGETEESTARKSATQVFETVRDETLYEAHNEFHFYTWGNRECCLPRGATCATLDEHIEHLSIGSFLVFIELRSPTNQSEGDADRAHRHVVRLTKVERIEDPVGQLFEGGTGLEAPRPVTRIEWDPSDALPFTLCLSTEKDRQVSIALGNIVLVEHGETQEIEELPPVVGRKAEEKYATRERVVGECCEPPKPKLLPLRFRPRLARTPLTHGFPLADLLDPPPDSPQDTWSAAALRALDPRAANPQILEFTVKDQSPPEPWRVRRDLLGSTAQAPHFVAEIDDAARACLRFGDDVHGRRPADGTVFLAKYRIGNGAIGNVGADSIRHVLLDSPAEIDEIRNPLPAFGGVDAEDIEAARRDAPQAFRTQRRAVTAADYASMAERRPDVQRAAAGFRWTGSWHTVFVTADRRDGVAVDDTFGTALRRHLEPFRMAGYDLEVDSPRFVPLDIMLHVCVKPGYFRSHVIAAVRAALSSVRLPDGTLGAFHPDNFTFGQPVFASRIIAAAQAVEGVESVRLDRFQRMQQPDPAARENGVIPMGRLEIAQLAADPNYLDRGRLTLSAGGGK